MKFSAEGLGQDRDCLRALRPEFKRLLVNLLRKRISFIDSRNSCSVNCPNAEWSVLYPWHAQQQTIPAVTNHRVSLQGHSAQPHPQPQSILAVPSRRVSPQWPKACIAQALNTIHNFSSPETPRLPQPEKLAARSAQPPSPCCAHPEMLQRFPAVSQSLAAVPNFGVSPHCQY